MIKFWTSARAALLAAGLALGFVVAAIAPASAQFTEQKVWGGTSSGSANAQTLTIANMPATIPTGVPFRFIAGFSNTTAATLNISAKGAKSIFKLTPAGPLALSGGELVAGQIAEVVYDGTRFQLLSQSNATAAQTVVPPQGYLTPCSATSVLAGCTAGLLPTADVTVGVGQTVTGLFYTPATGNQVPIYNGSQDILFSFSELTLTLSTSHLANTIYDVFVFNNGGVAQIGTGPAWSSSTAGSSSRGTGAATTQIGLVNGMWRNSVVITLINGATTYSNIPASQATYLGSIQMDGSNGVVSLLPAYGQGRKHGVWNAYNRLPIVMKAGEPGPTWTYNGTWRQSRADANNRVQAFTGLAQEIVTVDFTQWAQLSAGGVVLGQVGVGWNSTTVPSGFSGVVTMNVSGVQALQGILRALYVNTAPPLGLNNINMLEQTSAGTVLFNGPENGNVMTVSYRG